MEHADFVLHLKGLSSWRRAYAHLLDLLKEKGRKNENV